MKRSLTLAIVLAASALGSTAAADTPAPGAPPTHSIVAGGLFAELGYVPYVGHVSRPDTRGFASTTFGARLTLRPHAKVGVAVEGWGIFVLYDRFLTGDSGVPTERRAVDAFAVLAGSVMLELRPTRHLELLAGPSFGNVAREGGTGSLLVGGAVRASYLFDVAAVRMGPGLSVVAMTGDTAALTSLSAAFVFEVPGH